MAQAHWQQGARPGARRSEPPEDPRQRAYPRDPTARLSSPSSSTREGCSPFLVPCPCRRMEAPAIAAAVATMKEED